LELIAETSANEEMVTRISRHVLTLYIAGSENWLFGCARIIMRRTLLLSTDGADRLDGPTNSTVFSLSPRNEKKKKLILTKIGALNFYAVFHHFEGNIKPAGRI
jgi:hypothetical protein